MDRSVHAHVWSLRLTLNMFYRVYRALVRETFNSRIIAWRYYLISGSLDSTRDRSRILVSPIRNKVQNCLKAWYTLFATVAASLRPEYRDRCPEESTHLADNLKRENERTIARYLESISSHIRDSQGGTSRQNDPGKGKSKTSTFFPCFAIIHYTFSFFFFSLYGNRETKDRRFSQLKRKRNVRRVCLLLIFTRVREI